MQKITLTDFSRGMMQRTSPDEHLKGEAGYLYGFVPDEDQSVRSQWGIQSVGDGSGRAWYDNYAAVTNTSDILSLYPLTSSSGDYLVAIKEDGTIWWAKMADSDAPFTDSNDVVWKRIGAAKNKGFSIYATYDNQPTIQIESNPDYRFITELPLEVYKYAKQPRPPLDASGIEIPNSDTTTTIAVNGSHGGHDAVPSNDVEPTFGAASQTQPWYLDFTKDVLVDGTGDLDIFTGAVYGYSRSIVSAVLIHSRRYYRDGVLTRTKDYETRETVTQKAASGTSRTITVPGHSFTANDLITVNIGSDIFDGFHEVVSITTDTITYTFGASTSISTTAVTVFPNYVERFHRNQTAVVAYVNPYNQEVEAVTFPNFRRWPMYSVNGSTSFAGEFRPMPTWAVQSNRTQASFPFLDQYPYSTSVRSITSPDISDTSGTLYQPRSAWPKYGGCFQPYTYLDKDKTLLPGRGFVPRAFTGTMLGSILILGDIEWKKDSADTFLGDKRLTPTANQVAGSSENSSFGLRDGNTEPHRGSFYYSQDDIDVFDPRSVLRASGTDTRIAGMHTLNNRVVSVTTAGGSEDGVVTFDGNFGQLHPYSPGVLSNPFAVVKNVIGGGLGTADTEDYHNHGNPQTALWSDQNRVAFIDKSGYVYTTDGASVSRLADRYPNIETVTQATVHDHVAAASKHMFIYKNGYLYCCTLDNSRAAWSLLHKPYPVWAPKPAGFADDYISYNVLKSMRGTATELYMVVHTYAQQVTWVDEAKTQFTTFGDIVKTDSRVMRYALTGPANERGCQDGEVVQAVMFASPVLGVTSESKKVNWSSAGVNFYTETGCSLYATYTEARFPSGYNQPLSGTFNAPGYYVGNTVDKFIDPSTSLLDTTPYREYEAGYHNFEFKTGVGPQRVISIKTFFGGDVRIEGLNVWFSGAIPLKGESGE